MGQVTRAIIARSRLTLRPGATPDRRCHAAATTVQQTRLRSFDEVCRNRRSHPIFASQFPLLGLERIGQHLLQRLVP